MKRILILIIGLIGVAQAQYSPTSAKTRFVNGLALGTKLDSYFNAADSNAIYWRADSVVMAKYKGTARALAFAVSGGYLPISDTATMLSNYRRTSTRIENSDLRFSTISGVSLGASLFGLSTGYGLNGSGYDGGAIRTWEVDTNAISTKANVTGQLVGYATTGNLALKLNISDTAAMLSGYKTYYPRTAISAGTGISYNAATGVITNSSPSSGGTVTSVATNTGSGITGGTITSTGTIAADTSILSTKANVNGLLVGYTATGRFLDSLTNVQSRIQTKQPLGNYLTFADSSTILAGRWLPNRSSDSIAVIRALANSKGVGTVTSVGLTAPTGFTVSNTPITESGNLGLSFTAGYSLPTTASQALWDIAYNKRLVSAGLSSSQLTLTLGDASTVTASVPTFNQNTTGTAGSLSAVLSKTLGGAGDVNGILKANGSGVVSAAIAGDITDLISGTYLPLSGGTLTGALAGTSTTLSSDITSSGGQGRFGGWANSVGFQGAAIELGVSSGSAVMIGYNRNAGVYIPLIIGGGTNQTTTIGGNTVVVQNNGVTAISVASTGASTFANAISGTSLSMSGEGLFGGAVTDGANKLIVNGGVKFGTGGTTTITDAGAITASSSMTAVSKITSTNGGFYLQNSVANSSEVGLVLEGAWPWTKYLDTETSQNSYGEYIDGSVFFAKRIPFADRNSAVSSVGTNIYTINLTDGATAYGGSLTASSFVKSGGTSTQFLKADGSVDGNTYLTSASITGKLNISDTTTMLSNYARLSGANFTGSIGSTRGVFNNSTQSQLEIFGWNNIQGASTNAGEIRFGGTSSVQGRLIYSSSGNSTLYLDNTFDNANAEIKLRTRVAGTAVDALTLTSTAATFPSTMKSAGLIQPISLKTSNYTLTTNDHTVIFNTASGNLTATLPAGVEGQIFVLRKSAYGISTNDLTITPNGSETIEGAASYTISACSGVAVTLQFLSGNWYIINMAFIGNPC